MGIKVVSMEDLDNLETDEKGDLYWKGRPVVRATLDWWVSASIIITAVATAVIAIVSVVGLYH